MLIIGKCDRLARTGEIVSVKLPNGKTVQAKVASSLTNLTPVVGRDGAGNWYAWGRGRTIAPQFKTVSRISPKKRETAIYPFMVGSEIEGGEFWRSGNNEKKNLSNEGIQLIGFTNLGEGQFVAFIKVSSTLIKQIEKGQNIDINCENADAMIWYGGKYLRSPVTIETLSDNSYNSTKTVNPSGKIRADSLVVNGNNSSSSTFSSSEAIAGSQGNLTVLSTDTQAKFSSFAGLTDFVGYTEAQSDRGEPTYNQYWCKSRIDPPTEGQFSFPYPLDNRGKVAVSDKIFSWNFGYNQNWNYQNIQKKRVYCQVNDQIIETIVDSKYSSTLQIQRNYNINAKIRFNFYLYPRSWGLNLFEIQALENFTCTQAAHDTGINLAFQFWYPADLGEVFSQDNTEVLAIWFGDRSTISSAPESFYNKTISEESWQLEIPIVNDIKEEIYQTQYFLSEVDFQSSGATFQIAEPFFYNFAVQVDKRNYYLYRWVRSGVRKDNAIAEDSRKEINLLIGSENSFFYEVRETIERLTISVDYGDYKPILEWTLYPDHQRDRDKIFSNTTIKFYTEAILYPNGVWRDGFTAYGYFGTVLPFDPSTVKAIADSIRTITIDVVYSEGGGVVESPKFLLDNELLPVKIDDSFLFVFNYNSSGIIEKNQISTNYIGRERSSYYDFPIAIKKEIDQIFNGIDWIVSEEREIDLSRTEWESEWMSEPAKLFYRRDGKKYIAEIELSLEFQNEEKQLMIGVLPMGTIYHIKTVNRLNFTIVSETEINFFAYENILPEGKAVIWSSNNCYWLIKNYLLNDRTKANLVDDNLYISQKLTLDEVRNGKKKSWCDRFIAQIEGEGDERQAIWKHDKLLYGSITGLLNIPIKGDFVSYY